MFLLMLCIIRKSYPLNPNDCKPSRPFQNLKKISDKQIYIPILGQNKILYVNQYYMSRSQIDNKTQLCCKKKLKVGCYVHLMTQLECFLINFQGGDCHRIGGCINKLNNSLCCLYLTPFM